MEWEEMDEIYNKYRHGVQGIEIGVITGSADSTQR
jgi:hypothetical protein